jgi:hypothetical protein
MSKVLFSHHSAPVIKLELVCATRYVQRNRSYLYFLVDFGSHRRKTHFLKMMEKIVKFSFNWTFSHDNHLPNARVLLQ